MLARSYAVLGRFDDAVATQRQAVAAAPAINAHRLHLADYLLRSGKKAEAKEELGRLDQGGTNSVMQAEVKRIQDQLER